MCRAVTLILILVSYLCDRLPLWLPRCLLSKCDSRDSHQLQRQMLVSKVAIWTFVLSVKVASRLGTAKHAMITREAIRISPTKPTTLPNNITTEPVFVEKRLSFSSKSNKSTDEMIIERTTTSQTSAVTVQSQNISTQISEQKVNTSTATSANCSVPATYGVVKVRFHVELSILLSTVAAVIVVVSFLIVFGRCKSSTYGNYDPSETSNEIFI